MQKIIGWFCQIITSLCFFDLVYALLALVVPVLNFSVVSKLLENHSEIHKIDRMIHKDGHKKSTGHVWQMLSPP